MNRHDKGHFENGERERQDMLRCIQNYLPRVLAADGQDVEKAMNNRKLEFHERFVQDNLRRFGAPDIYLLPIVIEPFV
jgi:hypothetical protein